ncbi:MAG: hypothetical protein ACLR0U_07520 [Enterocloster clostridioformis]
MISYKIGGLGPLSVSAPPRILAKSQGNCKVFSHGSHLVLVVLLLSLCLLQGIVPQLQPVYISSMYEENKAPRDFEGRNIGATFP